MIGNIPEHFYFHGDNEINQFIHIQVPMLLIKDRIFGSVSDSAKILYGLLLNRTSLSIRNGWTDENGRTYIQYTIESLADELGIGQTKAKKMFAELCNINGSGYGLIEKVRILNKPSRIYVLNFVSLYEYLKSMENGKKTEENQVGRKCDRRTVANATDGESQMRPTDSHECDRRTVANATVNYINTINNDYRNINSDQSDPEPNGNERDTEAQKSNPIPAGTADAIDVIDETSAYMALIRDNLEYEHHMKYDKHGDKELYEEIYETVCDVVCVKRKTIRINGEDYPYELVKSRFLKLNSSHVEYVMGCMKETVTKITNIRSYLITALYNAPSTMSHYYQQEVQHDMYGGGRQKKELRSLPDNSKKGGFNNFPQGDYDFNELEKLLLSNGDKNF